jgi:hypothetical protein
MNERKFHERLEAALEHLQGDTEPVRQLMRELMDRVRDLGDRVGKIRRTLTGLQAACEGELTALAARRRAGQQ